MGRCVVVWVAGWRGAVAVVAVAESACVAGRPPHPVNGLLSLDGLLLAACDLIAQRLGRLRDPATRRVSNTGRAPHTCSRPRATLHQVQCLRLSQPSRAAVRAHGLHIRQRCDTQAHASACKRMQAHADRPDLQHGHRLAVVQDGSLVVGQHGQDLILDLQQPPSVLRACGAVNTTPLSNPHVRHELMAHMRESRPAAASSTLTRPIRLAGLVPSCASQARPSVIPASVHMTQNVLGAHHGDALLTFLSLCNLFLSQRSRFHVSTTHPW